MKGKKGCKSDGGKVGNANVLREAEERKKGGRTKRASGGRAGSDKSPMSSAAAMEGRSEKSAH